jgi:hypothetical protein
MGRNPFAGKDEVAFIGNGPFDVIAFFEVHALSNGGGKVDVPLLTFFTLNELNFGWVAHRAIILVI